MGKYRALARNTVIISIGTGDLRISASILVVQILFMRFAWPGWQGAQIGAVIGMLLIGRKQLVEKFAPLRRRKGGSLR